MKNLLYTFIALVTLNISAKADGFRSKLNIRTFNNQPIIVEIDRINYNSPSREFIVGDLTPGDHKIKIWTLDRCNNPYAMGNNLELAFNGFINIPARSKVKAVLTYQRILKITDVIALPNNFYQECNNNIAYYGNNNNCGNSYGSNGGYYNDYNNDSYSNYNNYTNNNGYYSYTGNCNNNTYPTYSNYGNTNYCNEFQEVKTIVTAQQFDDTRVTICKQYIRTHSINSHQLEELIRLMTFESNKMDLAKFGYRYVNDQRDFYTVYDAFTFDSSINELINWINHQS